MKTINRSAFIVLPKEPYLRWAAALEAEAPRMAMDLRHTASVYLVPEPPDDGEEKTPPLAAHFEEIFEQELEAWCTDENTWPEPRDLRTFHAWFDVIGESVIADLAEGPLEHDEP